MLPSAKCEKGYFKLRKMSPNVTSQVVKKMCDVIFERPDQKSDKEEVYQYSTIVQICKTNAGICC